MIISRFLTLVVLFVFAQFTQFSQTSYASTLSCSQVLNNNINNNSISNKQDTGLQNTSTSSQNSYASEPLKVTNPPRDITYFIDQVTTAQAEKDTTPEYIDPAVERERQELWEGTRDVPLAIFQTFHENVSLLDFQLKNADPGVVKSAAPGDVVSLRWKDEMKTGVDGPVEDMSTNLAVSASALVSRALEHAKNNPSGKLLSSLTPENAKAVFIFRHGGGTSTTGHHVAYAIANYLAAYGVAVVGMDSPYHGNGPSPEELNPKEYFKYLRDFRYKIAGADTPVFVGGHSMGGVDADIIMRMSDDPELGFHEAFAGVISLSTPVDSAPGQSLAAKEAAADLITSNEELMALVPEAERDLMIKLLLAGKVSPLGGMAAEMFVSAQNWVKPEHNGAEWLKALYVMGKYDELVIGREDIFDDHVTQLSNTEVLLMGERIDHHGNNVRVAHMIFDHRKPVDENNSNPEIPETFSAIKDFIQTQLGQPLERGAFIDGAEHGLLVNVIKEYYNNLAFRVFARDFKMLVKESTPLISELGQKSTDLGKEIKSLKNELKNKANDEEKSRLQAQIADLEAQLAEIRGFQRLTHIPTEDPTLKAFAENNVNERDEIDKKIQKLFNARKKQEKDLKIVQEKRKKHEKSLAIAVAGILKQATEVDEGDQTEVRQDSVQEVGQSHVVALDPAAARELEPFIDELKVSVEKIVAILTAVNAENSAIVRQEAENQTYRINPPPELIAKYFELQAAFKDYNDAEGRAKAHIEVMIAEAKFGEEAQQAALTLWGSAEALANRSPLDSSVIGLDRTLRSELSETNVEISALEFSKEQLVLDYINQVASDYYTGRFTTIDEELDHPLSDLVTPGSTSNLAKLWKVWSEIWKARPPESESSLY